jgi:hypothetical protein
MSGNTSGHSTGVEDVRNPSLVREEVIRRSVASFVLGWFALVPWLGLLFACLAFSQSSRARRGEQVTWNPARPYRVAGLVLARIGVLITLLSLALMIVGAYWAAD